jgi:Mg2+/Co2+ transporter CorB
MAGSYFALVSICYCAISHYICFEVLFSLDPQQLDSMHDSDNKSEKRVVKLLDKPQRLLATILIGNNFVNVSIILLLTVFTNSILNFDQSPLIGFIFQTIIITFLLLLFGEIMPKIYATQNSRKVASAASSFLSFLETIFSPFVSLLVNSTSIVNNRLAKHAHSNISMDELSQHWNLPATAPTRTQIFWKVLLNSEYSCGGYYDFESGCSGCGYQNRLQAIARNDYPLRILAHSGLFGQSR